MEGATPAFPVLLAVLVGAAEDRVAQEAEERAVKVLVAAAGQVRLAAAVAGLVLLAEARVPIQEAPEALALSGLPVLAFITRAAAAAGRQRHQARAVLVVVVEARPTRLHLNLERLTPAAVAAVFERAAPLATAARVSSSSDTRSRRTLWPTLHRLTRTAPSSK